MFSSHVYLLSFMFIVGDIKFPSCYSPEPINSLMHNVELQEHVQFLHWLLPQEQEFPRP